MLQLISKRFYHEFGSGNKLPIVRKASARIGRNIRQRIDSEAQPVKRTSPTKTYEPFPFAVTEENKVQLMCEKSSPLYATPYTEQLEIKQTQSRNFIRSLAQQLYRLHTPVRVDITRLPCPIKPIVPAPVTHNYRNKSDYSIWRGLDGQSLTVGNFIFKVSQHGDSVCVEPNGNTVDKEEAIKIANIFQEFLQNHSTTGCSFDLAQDGGWRNIRITSNPENELMVVGWLSPRNLKVSQVIEERDIYKDFMVKRCREEGLNLKSLYYQVLPMLKGSEPSKYELLSGQPEILAKCNKLNMIISPSTHRISSFMAQELVIQAIRNSMEECFSLKSESLNKPLIISCPSDDGITALSMADLAQHVVGIDPNTASINEAKKNASLNGIENATFINTDLGYALEKVLDKYTKNTDESLFMCEVQGDGRGPNFWMNLKNADQITKMVLTLNVGGRVSQMERLVYLCRKTHGEAPPFVPVLVTPIDTLPHTAINTVVIAFERSTQMK